ncbi:MAG TPA: undecaprenyl-diphosphate phosphatase [Ktedonobacteraceae bacterium]|nr:undecaprenyl-diphosphate phosphatase [Ktedonobacteraceae bacterium]
MTLNIWQTIFLALLQGVTELFPISSLGHTVILPGLFGWANIETNTACGGQSCFLPIVVALHLGTTIALVAYFWRDWLQVILTLINSVKRGEVKTGTEEWVSWLVIIGTIPAGLIGIFLQDPLKQLFASPVIAAAFLVVNGSILFAAERLRQRSEVNGKFLTPKEREAQYRPLSSLTWKDAVIVGLAQSLALIPGISRSGSSMVAGLGVRLNHEDAARFSFLLGAPIIGAAALLEVPQLFGQSASTWILVGIGMVLSGVAAYLSTKFLMKYFETGRLNPFAYYCWGAGIVSLILLVFVLHRAS